MAKFAVYYVPGSNADLYTRGSLVIGRDVRAKQEVEILKELREQNWFKDDYVAKARPYGFHLTVGDSIDFDLADMLAIEQEIEDVLRCFNPEHAFTLTKRTEDFVTFRGPAVVLRYDANDYLKILHAVIAARVHPLGTGSGYLRRYLDKKKEQRPYRIRRTMKFLSPTVFDSYSPHFTVLNPYTGDEGAQSAISSFFCSQFGQYEHITLASVCLLVQMHEDENWHVHREFTLPIE
jgi:hypothetical protein